MIMQSIVTIGVHLYRYKLPVQCSRAKTIPSVGHGAVGAQTQPKRLLLIVVLLAFLGGHADIRGDINDYGPVVAFGSADSRTTNLQ